MLGFINGDNGKTQHVETWSVCKSQVEAVWMLREDFQALWHLQSKSQKKMLCQVVRMQHCFRNCNDLTVHMIAFELLKNQEFKPGQTILPMNKRSIINLEHKKSMAPQTNAILKSVLKAKEDNERTRNKNISIWPLMLSYIAGMAKAAIEKRDMILLKRKTLRMQLTFEPMRGAAHHRVPSSQSRDIPMSHLMDKYDRMHDVANSTTQDSKREGSSKNVQVEATVTSFTTEEDSRIHRDHFPLAGIYIIETGRCKIIQTDESGARRTVSVIGRNDSFGGAERLKIAVSF